MPIMPALLQMPVKHILNKVFTLLIRCHTANFTLEYQNMKTACLIPCLSILKLSIKTWRPH